MKDFSLPGLCDSVLQGLSFSGLPGGGKIRMLFSPDTEALRYTAASELANLLYLLFSYLLSEAKIEEAEVDASVSKKNADRRHLQIQVGVRPKAEGETGFNFSGFLNCGAVRSMTRLLSGSVDDTELNSLKILVPIGKARSSEDLPLDMDGMMEDFEDPNLCRYIIREYLDKREEYLQQIARGVTKEDFSAVHRAAHSIKGGAMNLRARRLSLAARKLEEQAKARRLEDADRLIGELREEFLRVSEYFDRISHKEG
jgi:HPt (histidine-containing phosphotransfer) domain-containing protein